MPRPSQGQGTPAPAFADAGVSASTGPPEAGRDHAGDAARGLAAPGLPVLNIASFGLPNAAYDAPAVAGSATGADL